jgi:aminocarboxymuconate-semialdehyde decarboxylase
MPVIDMHCHVNPEQFPPANGRGSGRWPSMDHFEPGRARVMIDGKNFRTVNQNNWDVDKRLEDMDKQGVQAEAISVMPELMSYWFEPQDGLDMSRHMNETIMNMCHKRPENFFGLGMVPLQDPALAAKELANIKAMGMAGIEIGSNINKKSIGAPEFVEFFQECQAQDLCVFVHALQPTFLDRLISPSITGSIGFPSDTGMTIASFIATGTAEKVPNLRIAFSHGGGSFPFMLPRMHGSWNEGPPAREGGEPQPHTVIEYARRFYYDSLLFDARAIRYLIDMMGHTQVTVGTDYPFGVREPHADDTLRTMGLSQEVYDDITWHNSFRFLGVGEP